MIDYPALKTEFETDPAGCGYAEALAAGQDWRLRELINQVRPTITVRRPDVTAPEVLEAIDSRDFIATTNAAHCAWLESVCQNPAGRMRLLNTDGTDTTVLGNIKRMLLPPTTRTTRGRVSG